MEKEGRGKEEKEEEEEEEEVMRKGKEMRTVETSSTAVYNMGGANSDARTLCLCSVELFSPI